MRLYAQPATPVRAWQDVRGNAKKTVRDTHEQTTTRGKSGMQRDGAHFTDGFITIRPYLLNDIPEMCNAVRESLDQLAPRKWIWCHEGYDIEEAKTWIESLPVEWAQGSIYSFAIIDAHDGQFLGGCALDQVDQAKGWANAGYWVRTSRTGQGIATVAVRLLGQFAFDVLGLTEVQIKVAIDNPGSVRVAEKTGACRGRVESGWVTFFLRAQGSKVG
jgi:ribosomal-protein-serine acetyltransferase